MKNKTVIGVDLAKAVFQVHGASMTGGTKVSQEAVASELLRVHG